MIFSLYVQIIKTYPIFYYQNAIYYSDIELILILISRMQHITDVNFCFMLDINSDTGKSEICCHFSRRIHARLLLRFSIVTMRCKYFAA